MTTAHHPNQPRRQLAKAVVTAFVMLAAAVVTNAALAQPAMNISTSQQSLAPGDTITVTGDNCGPDNATFTNHQVIATLVETATGVAYGSTQGGVSATGTWSVPLTADVFGPDGDYEVRAVCQSTSASTGTTVLVPGPAAAVTMVSPAGSPAMAVSPTAGERPLTVTVTGTSCGPTDAGSRTVTVELLDPSLQQVDLKLVNGTGGDWTTTFVIAAARINPYTVRAVCVDGAGGVVLSYPDQRVQVNGIPAVLVVSPQTVTPGSTITATADQCPDPELPRLGGSYSVMFSFEPAGTTFQLQNVGDGAWNATFVVPTDAPAGSYSVTATCTLEELGQTLTIFDYASVQYNVTVSTPTPTSVPVSTPTPTSTTVPTATPVPTVVSAQRAIYPDFEPLATPTPPLAVPAPTPVSGAAGEESGGAVISFTG